MKQAAVLAGGKGTRLARISGEIPKSMCPLNGKPLLEHTVETLTSQNITELIFFTGYKSEVIENYFGTGEKWNAKISYVKETEPLGTAGSLLNKLEVLDDDFLVVYGDTVFNVDINRFFSFHNAREADVTLFLHPNDHPHDSDLVEIDETCRITAFHKCPHPKELYLRNLVNAALYICRKHALENTGIKGQSSDFVRDIFPKLLEQKSKVFGYVSREYIKDMGTPERLERVEKDLLSGKVANGILSKPRPAIFLDRDGTLTGETDFVRNIEQISLIPTAGQAVRDINQSKYLAVLATNQPVIARGEVTESLLQRFHGKLETLLGREGGFLDAIYFCPHHPDRGFSGERPELKIKCDCRKPLTGMIQQARQDLNIDLRESWFVGDMTADVVAGQNAGMRSVLVRTGMAGRDRKYLCQPDYEVSDLKEAVQFILSGRRQIIDSLKPVASVIQKRQRVIIGGAARTGKSLAASCLRDILQSRGLKAHVISLDLWLKPSHLRGSAVIERYDLEAISRTIRDLASLKDAKSVHLPFYDRISRSVDAKGVALQINPEDIIIFEGTIALTLANASLGPKIYVESDSQIRRKRFWKEYSLRGMKETEIQKLFLEREGEEIPFIESTRDKAEYFLNFDGALT
jgi:histidinol-phosphate phosphatase family protein